MLAAILRIKMAYRQLIPPSILTLANSRIFAITVLGLIALALRIPFMEQPIRFDEANTYSRYVSQDLVTITTTYDAPNNHVFHSLLARVTTLGTPFTEWTLRLPALLAGLGVVIMAFLLGERMGCRLHGWYAGLLTAVSAHLILFSTNSRGYELVALCTLLSFWFVLNLQRGGNRRDWVGYITSNILGCYTIPIMVYPLCASALILLVSRIRERRAGRALAGSMQGFFLAHFCIGGLVILLYLPILVSAGADALIGNRFVTRVPWDAFAVEFPASIAETMALWLHDVNPVLILAGLASAVIALGLRFKQQVPMWVPFAALVLASLLITLTKQVIPYSRVWIFIYPFFLLLVASGLVQIVHLASRVFGERLSPYLAGGIALVTLGCGIGNLVLNDPVVGSREGGSARDVPALMEWLETADLAAPYVVAAHHAPPSIKYYGQQKGIPLVLDYNPDGPTYAFVQDQHQESIAHVIWASGLVLSGREIPEVARFSNSSLYLVQPSDYFSIGSRLESLRLYPGFFESSWYGLYSCESRKNWILHVDHGRQLYLESYDNTPIPLHLFFDEGTGQWIYLWAPHYPKMYFGEEQYPLIWKEGTRTPHRVFTDPATGKEFTEKELREGHPELLMPFNEEDLRRALRDATFR
jgi:hypothetical protein